MHGLEPVDAWRVVGVAAALDGARWHGDTVEVVRLAPDEALGLGATGVDVEDPDAIAEPETGFSRARLSAGELETVLRHVEWEVSETGDGAAPPGGKDAAAQGKIAGVPAKLLMGDPATLVVQTCYVHDLRSRLGW